MSPHNSALPLVPPSAVAIPLLFAATFGTRSDDISLPCGDKQSYWVDIAVAVGIISLLGALLILAVGKRETVLPQVKRSLVGHLRFSQAGALSRGVHFRITFQQHSYTIEQLQDNDGDGIWAVGRSLPAWQVALPKSVMIEAGTVHAVEFDKQGLLTSSTNVQDGKITIQVRDVQNGHVETIHLLPAGQVG